MKAHERENGTSLIPCLNFGDLGIKGGRKKRKRKKGWWFLSRGHHRSGEKGENGKKKKKAFARNLSNGKTR